jgi:diphosphomevalonate decarboxylase
MVLAMTDAEPKPTPSREAMRRTRSSSPLYPAWNAASETDLVRLCEALERGDLAQVGQIAEDNALGMHATMLAARPAIRYLTGASLAVLDEVIALRVGGVSAYATIDAGPNIVVFCPRADAVAVARSVERLDGVCSVRIAGPGPGARLDGEPA